MTTGSIRRKPQGKGFVYIDNTSGRQIRSPVELERIKKLRIPPAYETVVICKSPHSKVQAYGRDAKGRKQTIYSREFVEAQKTKRFANLAGFHTTYARIKRDVNQKLESSRVHPRDKLIALIVCLMMECHFRIGSLENVEKYGTFGLTTLQRRHVAISGTVGAPTVTFSFVGKKNVLNNASCGSRQIVAAIRPLLQTGRPQAPLFCYKEGSAQRTISAKEVNDYFKTFDANITAKDIRTYSANVLFVDNFKKEARASRPASDTAWKKVVREAVKRVAHSLHNTPAVARSAYIQHELVNRAETDDAFRRRLLGQLT